MFSFIHIHELRTWSQWDVDGIGPRLIKFIFLAHTIGMLSWILYVDLRAYLT